MTIVKCDRCGREITSMEEVFIVQGYNYSKPCREFKTELCEWCFKCIMDEAKMKQS